MMARFIKYFNELKVEVQSENKSKKKKFEKQKAEIEGLKEKCHHLEEAVSYIRTLIKVCKVKHPPSTVIRKISPQMIQLTNSGVNSPCIVNTVFF